MTNLEKLELFKNVDDAISVKLNALRDRIWKEAEHINDEELEEFIENLRISAVFCSDAETYVEVQAQLGSILNRLANGRLVTDRMRSADIMKKLGIR